MRSEREKMLGGELYDPLDPQLAAGRRRARLILKALNDTGDDRQEERARRNPGSRGGGCPLPPVCCNVRTGAPLNW